MIFLFRTESKEHDIFSNGRMWLYKATDIEEPSVEVDDVMKDCDLLIGGVVTSSHAVHLLFKKNAHKILCGTPMLCYAFTVRFLLGPCSCNTT